MLSVVVTTRNDNHGEHLVERTNVFIDTLYQRACEAALKTELIIVEWNPPEWSKPLSEVLIFPSGPDQFFSARIITVPKELHDSLASSYTGLPIYQMIAKNVGVRRARYPWILCTNPDLLFSPGILEKVAELPEKDTGCFYRVFRQDIAPPPVPIGHEDKMGWCAARILPEGLQDGVWEKLHTHACGDFTLLHCDSWFDSRAYPELHIWSIHIDSLFNQFIHRVMGMREVVWDGVRVFHTQHPKSWTINPAYGSEFPSLRDKLGHVMNFVRFLENNGGKKLRLNPETWGYSDVVFEETVVC